jgi:hypothetical protein
MLARTKQHIPVISELYIIDWHPEHGGYARGSCLYPHFFVDVYSQFCTDINEVLSEHIVNEYPLFQSFLTGTPLAFERRQHFFPRARVGFNVLN